MQRSNFEIDALSISKIGHGKYLNEKAMLYVIPKLMLYYYFVHIKHNKVKRLKEHTMKNIQL